MTDPIYCLSLDARLKDKLSSQCDDDDWPSIQGIEDADSARKLLAEAPISTLFVDCRDESRVDGLAELLRDLKAGGFGAIDLIAVSDGWYPVDCADLISLMSVRTLRCPLRDDDLRAVFEFIRKGGRINGDRRFPDSRQLECRNLRLVTHTPAMFEMVDQLSQIAARDVTLLLVGETGTGKTTLAQIVHCMSDRRKEPLQNVACGALPRSLIESELFGHTRGAFTGADRDKTGRFEAAGRGTLLLDEIDVLSSKEQVKLLRVIETRQFEPVGATETRESQARLIVASNVDLETLTKQQQFRSDLYFRLNVLQFVLLPLRERQIDIIPLAMQFIRECCELHRIEVKRVSHDFLQCLMNYQWPGNLRELKNQLQRSVLFCKNAQLCRDDLAECICSATPATEFDRPLSPPTSLAERVAQSERRILEDELQKHNHSRTATARSLGISRVGLYKKMRKHGMM